MLLLLEKHLITSIDIHLERNCLDKKFLSLRASRKKKEIKWRPRILPDPLFLVYCYSYNSKTLDSRT